MPLFFIRAGSAATGLRGSTRTPRPPRDNIPVRPRRESRRQYGPMDHPPDHNSPTSTAATPWLMFSPGRYISRRWAARRLGSCVGVEYRKSICKISRMSRHRPPAQAHCSGLRAAHARPDQRDEKQRAQRPVGDTDPVVIAPTHDHHFRLPCQHIGQQLMGLRNRAGNRQNWSPLGIGYATAREIGGLQFLGLSDGNQFHRDADRLQIRGHLRPCRGSGRNADRPPPSASVRPVRANALYAITLVAPRHQECTVQAEVPRGRDQA